MSRDSTTVSTPWKVGFFSLLDAHSRVRLTTPLVTIVMARTRRDARTAFQRWAQAVGKTVWVSPRPSAEVARAALKAMGGKHTAVVFVGSELEKLWHEARAFTEADSTRTATIVATASQVASVLADPLAPVSTVVGLIQGLVPVDPVEEELVARVIQARRLAPFLRSPQEGILYFLLEARKETRGLFKTNQRVARSSGGTWEVDLVAREAQLVIEIDGREHDGEPHVLRDEAKERDVRALGFDVLRFSNAQVSTAPIKVLETILHKLALPGASQKEGP